MRWRNAIPVVAALLLSPAFAAANDTQAPALLNTLELQVLLLGDEPADHVGLRDHFLALAVRYDKDARRYDALAQAMGGNPNRAMPPARAHAVLHAERARADAAAARALAVYHERIAAGEPAVAPAGAGAFHNGKGAPEPTERSVRAVAAAVRTRSGHRAIAEYFDTTAGRLRNEADVQVMRARAYRALANDRTGLPAALECERRARVAREAAVRAEGRALVHRQLATLVGTD